MPKQLINTQSEMSRFAVKIAVMPIDKPIEFRWGPPDKKRSPNLNALSHVWYAKVSRVEGEYTPEGVKCECKLRFGIPIMMEDPDFAAFYDSAIGHLTYEQKIKAMRFIPVTRLMKTKPMMRYMKHLQSEYAGRVDLRFPDEPPIEAYTDPQEN